MFPESEVTEIYCMADDFCKEFVLRQEKYMVEDKNRSIAQIEYSRLHSVISLPIHCWLLQHTAFLKRYPSLM